uniref:Proliferation marker protein Ki-67-like n=1 Tax=Phascolarctos cinereus TaxID=38626 RepID=A0A6P5JW92_PHACI|nr:proliferation marker protein Ki-67-like [Phascolarctos cinereus]
MMLNNFVLNPKMDMNEDLAALPGMFETPIKKKTANVSPDIGRDLHNSSGDEDSLEPEKLIRTIPNTVEQLYGQSMICCPANEIIQTLKKIPEIGSGEITKMPLQEVDVDPKILTPNISLLKNTCTSKENRSTPHLSRIKKTAALDQKVTYVEEKFESGNVEDLTTRRLIRTPKEREEHLIEDVKVVKKSGKTSQKKCDPEYSMSIEKLYEIPKIELIENTPSSLGKLRGEPKKVEELPGHRNMTVHKEKAKAGENFFRRFLGGFRRVFKTSKVKPEDLKRFKLMENARPKTDTDEKQKLVIQLVK